MTVYHQKLPASGKAREALRAKGQFWTPAWVAQAMVAYSLSNGSEHLFDPAVGEGVFLRAGKIEAKKLGRSLKLFGTEVDAEILEQAYSKEIATGDLAGVEVRDFLLNPPQILFDAIVGNPPYIRHHRLPLETKQFLKAWSGKLIGKSLDGRTGLHVYFLLRALTLLREHGQLAFILPADVCEGKSSQILWQWITSHFCLEAVITFGADASPFPGVDTNALVFLIRKSKPQKMFTWVQVKRAWTNDLTEWIQNGMPNQSSNDMEVYQRSVDEGVKTGFSRYPYIYKEDCPRLGDFCTVMRGIATGDNDFFFLTRAKAEILQIPTSLLLPAVGRTRDVYTDILTREILDCLDQSGRPTLLFAPDARHLSDFPREVQSYLQEGEERGLPQKTLIGQRKPWYCMEKRRIPPFLFAYLGRRNVRFIRNEAGVVPLTSFLCVYPKQNDLQSVNKIWRLLRHPALIENLVLVGKSYGSGAVKVEPRALESLPIPEEALQESGIPWLRLFEEKVKYSAMATKTVEEMAAQREEARKNAQAADKGKMTTNA
jgi:hypothetical protein